MPSGSTQNLCFRFKGFATKEYMLGNLAVQGTWTMTAFFGAKVCSFVNMIFPRYDTSIYWSHSPFSAPFTECCVTFHQRHPRPHNTELIELSERFSSISGEGKLTLNIMKRCNNTR